MDWTACDLVEVNSCRSLGRPIVSSTGVRAETIVESWELGESIEDAYSFRLSQEQICKVLEFAGYRSELKLSA